LRGDIIVDNVRDKVLFDLQLANLSEVSQAEYLYHINRFAEFCNKPLEQTDEEDVRLFLHHLRHKLGLSPGTVNHYHTCIKFLFQVTLGKPWDNRRIPRLKGYNPLPVALSKEDVGRILIATTDIKQLAILSTVYASGLRNSEVCRLKVSDIKSNRMQIFVRKSKGNKDRYTILSKNNLELLRRYWTECGKPHDWLFPGAQPGTHIHPGTVLRYFKEACKRAGINPERLNVHSFRHAFASHALEDGIDLHIIKRLLGHSSIVSTSRYLQMLSPESLAIQSPLDSMEISYGR
jgi:integrase/recombinase XerD